jgi:Zn-dependent metalloprotease
MSSAAQAAPARTVASCDVARLDKAAGVARSLGDCGRVDMAAGAEGASRQALGRLSGALGVRRDTSDLGLMSVSRTSAGPRVRFQQFVGGVPVRNGQVAVALDPDGSVIHVGNGAVAATKLDTDPDVGRAAALLTARRRVPSGFDLVSSPTVKLVAEPSARGALELAWLVFLPTRAPRADWNVVVSARSGDVLRAFDSIKQDTGSAQTYAPNPVQQSGNTGLLDGADGDQTALTSARLLLSLTDPTRARTSSGVPTSIRPRAP